DVVAAIGMEHEILGGADVEGEGGGADAIKAYARAIGRNGEHFGPVAAVDFGSISAITAFHQIAAVTRIPDQAVVAGLPKHLVVASAARQHVIAVAAEYQVVAALAA